MENTQNKAIPEHDKFKSGQGYGSAEPGADAQEHQSDRQYGDNPLPPSGGNWRKAGEMQPDEDPEANLPTSEQANKAKKIEKQDDAIHH